MGRPRMKYSHLVVELSTDCPNEVAGELTEEIAQFRGVESVELWPLPRPSKRKLKPLAN